MSHSSRTVEPPTVVKADGAAHFLRLVPQIAATECADSLVLVLFSGRRTHGAMRVDLLHTEAPLALKRWAQSVLGRACKVQGVDGVVPVVYTDDAFAPSGRPPAAPVLRELRRQATRMGLDVRDLLVVAADGWGSLLDPELPRGGRPLDEVAPQDGDPAFDLRPRSAPEYGPAQPGRVLEFADHLECWWAEVDGPGGVLHGVDLAESLSAFGPAADPEPEPAMQRYRFGKGDEEVIALVEGMLEVHDPDEPVCPCRALLYSLATRQGLENLVLLQIGWGRAFGSELWAAAQAGDRTDPVLEKLAAAISGGAFPRPDVERIERAMEALLEVGALVPPESRAPVDSMLCWLYWARGGSSAAAELALRALQEEPGRDVPSLVLAQVQRGVLPEWAFRADPTAPDEFALPA